MLRIFLILTVIAGLAAGGVALTRVSDKIGTLSTNLTNTETQLRQSQQAEATARRELTATRETLATTTEELEATKEDLEDAQQWANQQETRANRLEQQLEVVTLDRNQAQTELGRWRAFNMTVEQIWATIGDNRRLVDENDGLTAENRVLSRTVDMLTDRLRIYEGHLVRVVLPPHLRGQVIAVDPKYEFIVLDIGEEDGVLERGEMLVNRSGKLVAKVRILSVESQRSIANVLPDWKQAEILEGDTVIVGL